MAISAPTLPTPSKPLSRRLLCQIGAGLPITSDLEEVDVTALVIIGQEAPRSPAKLWGPPRLHRHPRGSPHLRLLHALPNQSACANQRCSSLLVRTTLSRADCREMTGSSDARLRLMRSTQHIFELTVGSLHSFLSTDIRYYVEDDRIGYSFMYIFDIYLCMCTMNMLYLLHLRLYVLLVLYHVSYILKCNSL